MFLIKDNLGNEAEADDIDGALLAAKTLFEDNDNAVAVQIVDGSRVTMTTEGAPDDRADN
jgi:hypothetical protein